MGLASDQEDAEIAQRRAKRRDEMVAFVQGVLHDVPDGDNRADLIVCSFEDRGWFR